MSDKNLPAIQEKQQEAVQMVEKYRSEHALVFVNDEDLKTHPLFIPEVTILAVKQDDFHNISGSLMPKGHITDRIGEASGVSFIATECGTRKDGDWVYVGRAQGKKRQTDGTWRLSQAHEYEFDVDTRAELDFNGKYGADKYKTDKDKLVHKLEMKKFARQRAGTGARLKVIRELVGMPTGFKQPQLQGGQMVFARVALNTQEMLADPDTRQAAIRVALGATDEIFGPTPRNVTPEREALPEPEAESEEPPAESATAFPGLPADDDIPGFDGPAKEPTEVEILRSWFKMRIAEVSAKDTKQWIKDFLAGKLDGKDSQDVEVLKQYKGALERKLAAVPVGGAK